MTSLKKYSRLIKSQLVVLSLLLFTTGCAYKLTEGVVAVSPVEASNMLDSGKVTLVVTESAFANGRDHVLQPSASQLDLKKLPASKKAPIVVIGNGPKDKKSPAVANAIRTAGYKEVHYSESGQ
jgi:energy-coupling factor transporter transmembrane protein EcfT